MDGFFFTLEIILILQGYFYRPSKKYPWNKHKINIPKVSFTLQGFSRLLGSRQKVTLKDSLGYREKILFRRRLLNQWGKRFAANPPAKARPFFLGDRSIWSFPSVPKPPYRTNKTTA